MTNRNNFDLVKQCLIYTDLLHPVEYPQNDAIPEEPPETPADQQVKQLAIIHIV